VAAVPPSLRIVYPMDSCGRDPRGIARRILKCNCAGCPVWAEYDLSKGYFCIHGASE